MEKRLGAFDGLEALVVWLARFCGACVSSMSFPLVIMGANRMHRL